MKNIILIGSGNVATHIGLALVNNGYNIRQVWSRKLKNAKILAQKLNCKSTTSLNNLLNADLYIISIKDDILKSTVNKLNKSNIVHTSGSNGLEVFEKKNKNFGIFYPLQTFNINIKIDIKKTPILIEANNKNFEKKLLKIGNNISETVILMTSIKRKQLHIAAVFACNFSNHMYTIADSILKKSNIDFNLLLPIINQTVNQLQKNNPKEIQTGPAKRKDKKIIQYHIDNLTNKNTKEIYQLISKSIMENDI